MWAGKYSPQTFIGILSLRNLELLTAWGEVCGVGCNLGIAVAVEGRFCRELAGWSERRLSLS